MEETIAPTMNSTISTMITWELLNALPIKPDQLSGRQTINPLERQILQPTPSLIPSASPANTTTRKLDYITITSGTMTQGLGGI